MAPFIDSEEKLQASLYMLEVKRRSDRLMNFFLGGFFLAGLAFASFFDTWGIALVVGTSSLLAYFSVKTAFSNSDFYQYVLSAILAVFMALFIYQMHGLFEMHFFAFIGSAILITYQNWKLQIPMMVMVVLHHAVFGYLQNSGADEIYFTQLDSFELQTFVIHVVLAAVIFFICGLWAYQLRKSGEVQIRQTLEVARLQKEAILLEEKKKSEEALKIAYAKAEHARLEAENANKAKSVFLATMSHEIRTPMNGVIGMASLLSETTLNTEQKEYTETIRSCGETLLAVINDVLDFSKIESGKMELETKDFDLRTTIEEVLDVFSSKAAQVGLDLIYQIDHNVPAQIIGDSLRLRQVLINLVGNAIKFTKTGEIFVGVHLAAVQDKAYTLKFEVRDTGIGIPEDKINRLFKAFSQVDSSTTRKYGGTGLGLAISERLVGLMGGNISVESQVGKGTTFSFLIQAAVSTQALPNYVTSNSVGMEGKRVLVVDDNQTNLTIFKGQLEQWKMIPTLAYSGREALEILSGNLTFDLILSDMQMPEMDGVQLALSIKKIHPSLPIILLSSIGDDSVRKNEGLFAATLTKPVKQNALFQAILTELRKQGNLASKEPAEKKPTLSPEFSKEYPLHILIAEDNVINQKLTQKVLSKLGYDAEIADDGMEAVAKLLDQKHDLVLMDVQMPVMDGLEATRQIRLLAEKQPVIIAMTANALQGDREECMNAGMNDYISKPVKLDELVSKLAQWSKEIQAGAKIKSEQTA